VWTSLYIAMGIALAIIILKSTAQSKKWAYIWFGAQLALNTIWSLVFFGLHAPWAGAAIILALITAIILTMREFKKISVAATWLLVPYLAWVCFATYLTFGIAILNP
ncbi:MAG: TspO/MBR family protein, partial [Candidatus Microsaccharimonas sp.]